MNNFKRFWDALTFMAIHHGDQKRKSGNVPYIIHPIRVVHILRNEGFTEEKHESLLIAALFHDLLEDTSLKFEELEKLYGTKISIIVLELTKPIGESKNNWLRKFSLRSWESKAIKMADRIDNLLDIPFSSWTSEKQISYAKEGKIILEQCLGVHKGLEKKLEEAIKKVLDA